VLGRRERPPVAYAGDNEKKDGGVVLCVGLGLGFFYFLYKAFAIHRDKRSRGQSLGANPKSGICD
jgi:hypothetical protein